MTDEQTAPEVTIEDGSNESTQPEQPAQPAEPAVDPTQVPGSTPASEPAAPADPGGAPAEAPAESDSVSVDVNNPPVSDAELNQGPAEDPGQPITREPTADTAPPA